MECKVVLKLLIFCDFRTSVQLFDIMCICKKEMKKSIFIHVQNVKAFADNNLNITCKINYSGRNGTRKL